jgi:hypothetical protein
MPDHRTLVKATAAANRLATRCFTLNEGEPGLRQSLAKGHVGIALLHVERAHAGIGDWNQAHAWLSAAVRDQLYAGPNAGLFYGAPSAAFAVHAAAASGRYARARAALHAGVEALTRRRLAQAHARIDQGAKPAFREYDALYGLTGLGAYLLRNAPQSDVTRDVLAYLVRLTEPLPGDEEELPGWWTDHGPQEQMSPEFSGGHGNLGMAHGIAGPLALLSTAMRQGTTVEGHADSIERICRWLDAWRQDGATGSWWPEWVTREETHKQRTTQPGPARPSWCYGTPGLARAQQLAGIATGNIDRRRMAEDALIDCLLDAEQLANIVNPGLCHGWAGVFQTLWRAASDATTPALATHLPALLDTLLTHQMGTDSPGFLTGNAGLALALHTAATDTAPASGWDTCLLLN